MATDDRKYPIVVSEPPTVEVVAVYDTFEEAVVRALQEVRAAGGGTVELHEAGCGWSQNDTCACRVTVLDDDTGCA